MSTQQIIDAWESGVEPYNATTKPVEEMTLEEMLQFIGENCLWIDDRAPSRKEFPTS